MISYILKVILQMNLKNILAKCNDNLTFKKMLLIHDI